MRTATKLPLAAGFGISTPDQAGAVAKMADGVVVGSAIVRQIEKDPAGLESLARSLCGENEEMTSEEAWRLLQDSRKKIDEIDVKLVDLLNRRAGVVEDIASAKRVLTKKSTIPAAGNKSSPMPGRKTPAPCRTKN